jgi:hypothetical protein
MGFLLLCPFFVWAIESIPVAINEIAWMGQPENPQDEWIELYNNTNLTINLEGWKLIAQDGSPEISLTGLISENGFFLLERTDEETVPGILANQIYKGALNNSGENLELHNDLGKLIDSISCSQGWFAGNNDSKQTMERKDSQILGDTLENWQNSQNPGGTPKAENGLGLQEYKEEVKDKSTDQSLGLVINEILPDPQGISDAVGEYIEIFNPNQGEVNLQGWKIADTVGSIKSYFFPQSTIIDGKGFLVFYRPTTKITLNNEKDGLTLFAPDGKVIDSVVYDKRAIKGQSLNRTKTGWVWSAFLTPGSLNSLSPSTKEEKENLLSPERTQEDYLKKENEKEPLGKELAGIGEQVSDSGEFPFIFFVAFSLAFFSGAMVFVLRKKLKNFNL